MADPFTAGLAIVGAGASFAGSMTQASGAKYQAAAQANEYMYRAGVARINQQIAKQNADYERYVGEVNATNLGLKTQATIGQQRAAQGASGFDVNTGSNVRVQDSTRMLGKTDIATARANAARRAYGYELTAWEKGVEADYGPVAAANAKKAGNISASASILGGVGSVASKWLQASSAFGFGGGSGSDDYEYPGAHSDVAYG